MSRLRTPNGDDHPEAAHKQLLDAQSLLGQQRADGAAYLSGYVVECALKSLWLHETGAPTGNSMPWVDEGGDGPYELKTLKQQSDSNRNLHPDCSAYSILIPCERHVGAATYATLSACRRQATA
jgi:hypothetical protein